MKRVGKVRRLREHVVLRVLPLLRGRWALLLGLAVFGSILLATPGIRQSLAELLGAVSYYDGQAISSTIRSYGPLAPAVAIALIQLHAVVPVPAELLTLANGLAFGFWGGLAVSWSGFMLSALSIYAAGRLWGRPLLERTVSQHHRERLDRWLEREGSFPLLAVRLVPLVPFNAVCIAAGVIRAPLWAYTWITGVGILPLGATLSFLGSRLGESSPHLGAPFWILSLIFLTLVLATWYIARRRTRG